MLRAPFCNCDCLTATMQAAVHFLKSAFSPSSSLGNPSQVRPIIKLFSCLHHVAPYLRAVSCTVPFLFPLNPVLAAQHRLVNEQLAALAQRIHGFTVETVKPAK